MKGEAADIHQSDMAKLREWFLLLMDGDFDQLIMERATKDQQALLDSRQLQI